jgi:hypothetical protein
MASEKNITLLPAIQPYRNQSDANSLPPTQNKAKHLKDNSPFNPYSASNSIDTDEYQVNLGPGSYNIPSTLGAKIIGTQYKSAPSYMLPKTKRSSTQSKNYNSGVFYDPNFKFIKQSSPGCKIGKSIRMPITSRIAAMTPGPKYNVIANSDISKSKIGPKLFPIHSTRKNANKSLYYPLYTLESIFEKNIRTKKGSVMGKSKRGLPIQRRESPGPGEYDYGTSNLRSHGVSFSKVVHLSGIEDITTF